MKKILGITGLLVAICVYTALGSDQFLMAGNLENLVHRTALFGILGIGAAFVIITGGIDLSIGSVVCLVGCSLPWLLRTKEWSPWAAVPAVLAGALAIGLAHGLLITKARLQPFVVTLCGLLVYRGFARWLTGDASQGFGGQYKGLRRVATEKINLFGPDGNVPQPDGTEKWVDVFQLPATTLLFIVVALLAAVLLNMTVFGRHLMALGRNEQAARYSGIRTDRLTLLAYVICAGLAGFGGMLFIFDINGAQPTDFGKSYELYAIAAAVLGGCSLRGGEGSITGLIVGAAVMVVLSNMINLRHPDYQNIEDAIIGAVILVGVFTDETVERLAARRRAAREARLA